MVERFYIKLGDPSWIVFETLCEKTNRQTDKHRQKPHPRD